MRRLIWLLCLAILAGCMPRAPTADARPAARPIPGAPPAATATLTPEPVKAPAQAPTPTQAPAPTTAAPTNGAAASASALAPAATPTGQASEMATLLAVAVPLPMTAGAAWPAGAPLVLGDHSPRRGGSAQTGLAATISLYWDDEALFLEALVRDNTPLANDRVGDKIWDGDGLEIALGTRPDADPRRAVLGAGDYLVGIAAGPEPRGWNFTAQRPLQDMVAVTATLSGGYLLRARVPWANFGGYNPEAGQVVPLDVALDEGRPGANGYTTRVSQLIWHGDESFYTDPRVWGFATFGQVAPLAERTGGAAAPGQAPDPAPHPAAAGTDSANGAMAQPRPAHDALQITVAASRPITPVSPLAFGANVGPWQPDGPGQGPLARAAGFGSLRFPGGNWSGEQAWGANDLDAFVAQARYIGAEPVVNVPLLGGRAEDAARLVRYARDSGYAIRYWAIGNEPDLYAANGRAPGYSVARFNQEWRAFAQAMKAADPQIRLVGPEIHQYVGRPGDPRDGQGVDWMEGFLRGNADLVDVVSFHRYPFEQAGAAPQALLANPAEWDHSIPYLRARVRAITGRDLPLAVTEVNSAASGAPGSPAGPDSLLNALWWADVQGRLQRQGVAIADYCCLTGAGELSLLDQAPRPAYFVFRLYGHFGLQMLAVDAPPDLPAYAALAGDGALTLLVVNRAETALTAPIELAGFRAGGLAQGWLLDAAHQAETFISSEPASSSFVYAFPARSVTLLRVPAR